jgi:hypothetical protein
VHAIYRKGIYCELSSNRGKANVVLVFVFFLGGNRLQVLGLKDLAAIQTLYIIDAVTPGNNFGTDMVTHNKLMVLF